MTNDLIGGAWEDIRPHVEDSIRNGDFAMEIQISDADIAYVWRELQAVPSYCERYQLAATVAPLPVLMEDELRHTDDAPFCPDVDCPCHQDEALFDEFILRPIREGRLKIWEAQELLWPER